LPEAAAHREEDVFSLILSGTRTREEYRGIVRRLVFVDRSGGNEALVALLSDLFLPDRI
jgi:hypothetical protein